MRSDTYRATPGTAAHPHPALPCPALPCLALARLGKGKQHSGNSSADGIEQKPPSGETTKLMHGKINCPGEELRRNRWKLKNRCN
jgi:hypothetical protein